MPRDAKQLYLAKFDEINGIGSYLYDEYLQGRQTSEEIKETITSFLTNAVLDGISIALLQLFDDEEDYLLYREIFDDNELVNAILERKIDNKTYQDRIQEHLDNLDGAESVQKIIDTETHRVINTSIQEVGNITKEIYGSEITKTWETMLDDRVRDTHDYLQGYTVKLDEEYYTYNGDHALFPGGFGIASEDCNCRCWVTLQIEV